MARSYMSIGEILVTLKTEFPDITISKIRFLEGEGLIDPERTPSGYRKFREDDVDTLRTVLRMQRDEYLPLKVIKERMLKTDDAPAAKAPASERRPAVARRAPALGRATSASPATRAGRTHCTCGCASSAGRT